MIYVADEDKPHRCPRCWRIPDAIHASRSGRAKWWRIYRCQNGHRFTRLPIPGRVYVPDDLTGK